MSLPIKPEHASDQASQPRSHNTENHRQDQAHVLTPGHHRPRY